MVKTVLVIECTAYFNWYRIFDGACIPSTGEKIAVEQASYQDISLVSYGAGGGVVVSLNKASSPLPGTPQSNMRTVKIDFVLLRSVSRGVGKMDSRNLLFGLMHG